MSEHGFSHISKDGEPSMVDVGDKKVTDRIAIARAIVELGNEIVREITDNGFQTKKGPVFQVASLAGIMATKRTSDLIPLCHPLALNKADVDIKIISDTEAQVDCLVKTSGKTGVEMEALTGATVAALTIYDMCKAMSHEIKIKEVKLIHKSGGKKDYNAEEK
ncbi:cyclic pyranopterin monophosphate synthase MoaC [Portibacter lacus]|uniref:cyclic pyranopterin monophosphate synthase n=1 Tax=Portibacter lacus TaxID=1099794 RepID=A0AA37SQX9_9BACT|nr:cyclic pyranopterin monophosphate synthase MoaC [Portibacter lacus]GLR16085.1 cyclic pyranopterin monophosphate synthase accessory protein [Portibacter lacus]